MKQIQSIPKGHYLLLAQEKLLFPEEGLHYQFDIDRLPRSSFIETSVLAKGDPIPCWFIKTKDRCPHEGLVIDESFCEVLDEFGHYFLFEYNQEHIGHIPPIFKKLLESTDDLEFAVEIELESPLPTNAIKGVKHECSVDGCDGLTCFVNAEKAYENLTQRQFQVLIAKKFGFFCFFQKDTPHIVAKLEGKSEEEIENMRDELCRIWMDEVKLIPEKEYFLS